MGTLYNRTDIYDLFETEKKFQATRLHWDRILEGKDVHTLLDVSIGTGNLTLAASELGIELTGSDLSGAMLERCREKAEGRGIPITLVQSDFRELDKAFHTRFDCVASTGNSLPYVTNEEIPGVLSQMDALVKPGGYLYFDLRNWDKILDDRQRFFLYSPHFQGDIRINLVQVWDHNPAGSVTFNLLYTFEKDNRIVQKEIFEEHYHPVRRQLLLDALVEMGYRDIQVMPHPAQFTHIPLERADWYCVIARKGE